MTTVITLLALYCLGILLFTMFTRPVKTLPSFTVNSRKSGVWSVGSSLLATVVGGAVTIGLISAAYEAGTVAYLLGLVSLMGLALLWFLTPYIHKYAARQNVLCFEEYFVDRFNSARFAILVAVVNLLVFVPLIGVQFAGITALTKAVIIPIAPDHASVVATVTYLIMATLIIVYSAKLGLKGVYHTDKVQLVLVAILTVVILLPALVYHRDVLSALPSQVPDKAFWSGLGYGPIFLVGLAIFGVPALVVRVDMWQRIYSAKNVRTARLGFILPILGAAVCYIVYPSVGLLAKGMVGADTAPRDAAATVILTLFSKSPILLAFVLVALIAALMSTADSFLNAISISAVRAIHRKMWSKAASSQEPSDHSDVIWTLRGFTVVLGIVCAVFAYLIPITDLMVVGLSAVMILLPSFLTGLFAKVIRWPQRIAAELSVAVGLVVFVILLALGFAGAGSPKEAFVPAVACAFLLNFGLPPILRVWDK